MKTSIKLTTLCLSASLTLLGCARNPESHNTTDTSPAGGDGHAHSAAATVAPTAGNRASGTVTFTQVEGGVRVVASITGLIPGKHALHILDARDCSTDSAHFNPAQSAHGDPAAATHHLGDLGNLAANGSGVAQLDQVFPQLSFHGDSFIGRAVSIHAKADDFKTQPDGGAGPKIACGIIQ